MKTLKKTGITLGVVMALVMTIAIQTVNAALTILPEAEKGTDCEFLLNKFESENKVATKEESASNDAQNADKALEEATAANNAAHSTENMTACNREIDADSSACKTIDDAQAAYDKAVAAQEQSSEALFSGKSGSEKDNLLGCAIKTGRITLGMIPYFISYVTNFFLAIIGLICVLFIVLGGYYYIYGGISDQKEKGKKTIYHALLGMGVAILAWVIVNIIMAAVTS
jgi:hypothetical protein